MSLLLLPVFVPLLASVLCLAAKRSLRAQQSIAFTACSILLGSSIAILTQNMSGEIPVERLGAWDAPYGILFVADMFSGIMLVVSNLVGLAVLLYSFAEVPTEQQARFYFPLYMLLLMGVNGSFLTGDLFNLYVWFEVMLLSSFVLLCLGREPDQLEGAIKYVSINIFSSILFLSGLGVLYGKLGTLNMADIAMKLAEQDHSELVNSSAVLFLVAFGIKSALFPFFFWLPPSYHTPAVSVSALFAGLLTKVGVYALVRVFTLVFVHDTGFTHGLLLILAAATMVTGVLGAAAQFEMRKILSFHIISQIGYMVMGLALFTPLALAGAIFYIFHHIVVKTNLFLISGIILKTKGTSHLKQVGGLYQSAPFLSILFFIPAFSLGGIPPLSGFWAKFSVMKAGLEIEVYWAVIIGLSVGMLTLYSMTKIWGEVFWKNQPAKENSDQSIASAMASPLTPLDRISMYAPVILLAGITLWIGLMAEPFFEVSMRAAAQLLEPSAYISAVMREGVK